MPYYKAYSDFSGYAGDNLLGLSKGVYTKFGDNAAVLTAPPGGLPLLKTKNDALEAALTSSSLGGKDRTAIKNAAKADVVDALSDYAGYTNGLAKGDPVIIDLSGLPRYETAHPDSPADVTFQPENLRVLKGNVSGAITLRWKGDGKRSNYEVQTCTGDPMVEANWSYRGTFQKGKAELDGFAAGATVWARVRKLGPNNEQGPWSDPATLMVT